MSKKAQRRAANRKIELAKRAVAHSTPLFNPRESWTPRKKVGGVPMETLLAKQHQTSHQSWWYHY